MGHQRCSRPLWWEESFEEEAAWSRRSKRIQRSKQEGSEDSEESKGGLDGCSVRGDWNLSEQKQQQDSISADEGSNLRNSVGPHLSRANLGNVLLKKKILSRWTKYCSELYNYESCGDNAVLDCSQPLEEDLQPILREKVEIAVASLKKGKSAGVDNIPAELVQAGGETMIDVLTEILTGSGEQDNGLPHGLSRWLLHSLKRATCSSARTTELSASSVIRAKSC